jgi:hypothetical protein
MALSGEIIGAFGEIISYLTSFGSQKSALNTNDL